MHFEHVYIKSFVKWKFQKKRKLLLTWNAAAGFMLRVLLFEWNGTEMASMNHKTMGFFNFMENFELDKKERYVSHFDEVYISVTI